MKMDEVEGGFGEGLCFCIIVDFKFKVGRYLCGLIWGEVGVDYLSLGVFVGEVYGLDVCWYISWGIWLNRVEMFDYY